MTAMEVVAACALDAAVGDPRIMPHPVRWMGSLSGYVHRWVRTLGMGPRCASRRRRVLGAGFADDGIHGRLGFDRGWHGSP